MAETCPKCGYQPISTDACPRCGISVSKFLKSWRPKEQGPKEPIKIAERSGCKDDFFLVLKWVVRGLLILFIIGFALSQYFAWWVKHTHKIHGTTMNYYSSLQAGLFTIGEYDDETCCLDWLDDLRELQESDLIKIDQRFQDNLPPEEIRHLGFLFAKKIQIQDEGESPLIMCQTPIDSVRQGHGKPPGKNHLVLRANMRIGWMTPAEYAAIDKSKYVDLGTFMQIYNQQKLK